MSQIWSWRSSAAAVAAWGSLPRLVPGVLPAHQVDLPLISAERRRASFGWRVSFVADQFLPRGLRAIINHFRVAFDDRLRPRRSGIPCLPYRGQVPGAGELNGFHITHRMGGVLHNGFGILRASGCGQQCQIGKCEKKLLCHSPFLLMSLGS